MRRVLSVFYLILVSVVALAQSDPGYYFENYKVEMLVTKDNKYYVTEKIDAVFTERSRGIFRMIPTYVWVKRDVSEAQDGSATRMMHYKVDIDNVEVSENWAEMDETNDSLYSFRIGSPTVWIEGRHSYLISYTYEPYGDRIEQSDLFFYSVLGSGWDCGVRRFEFKIHFEKPISEEELAKLQVFAGPEGRSVNYGKKVLTEVSATCIAGRLNSIKPKNAVTVFLPLHEGYFGNGLHPKLDIIATWVFFAIAVACILFLLYKESYRGYKVTKVISFYPPDDCSSADVGALIDSSIDDCDVTSLIPWFAEKGYLKIDDTKTYPILHKVKDLPANAPEYQKTLFDGFFSSKDVFYMKLESESFGNKWIKCKKQLNETYYDILDYVDPLSLFVLIVAILAVSSVNCFAVNSNDGWVFGGVTTILFAIVSIMQIEINTQKKHSWLSNTLFIILEVGFLGAQLAVLLSTVWLPSDSTYIPANAVFGLNVVMGTVCVLASQLNRMSEYRKERLGQILGLQEFISTAEKDQLEHLQQEDDRFYYKILPYAVAFGMATTWAKKFEGINIPASGWYKCAGNDSLNSLSNLMTSSRMSNPISSSVSAARNAADAASSSSSGSSYSSSSSYSSGGGGYSGGGFGGGGGGRW